MVQVFLKTQNTSLLAVIYRSCTGTSGIEIENGSHDPGHAPYRGDLSSVG